jgi:hypothetical protein
VNTVIKPLLHEAVNLFITKHQVSKEVPAPRGYLIRKSECLSILDHSDECVVI